MATSNFRRASPAAVVVFTASVDPVTAEEVCGIAWPSICRRGAPLERNDPDLWGDVGQAGNDQGQTVRSRMRTPEGYSLTATTAFDAACRVVAGEIKPGFQTPSRAFGTDYILNFDGVVREDLNR